MTQRENHKPVTLFIHEIHQDGLLVKSLLQYCDFEVVSTTLEDLFEKIQQVSKIDLVVFDFVYDLKRLKICPRLKTEEKTRSAPLLAIVANPEIGQEEVKAFQIDAFIRAPIDIRELEKVFREYSRGLNG